MGTQSQPDETPENSLDRHQASLAQAVSLSQEQQRTIEDLRFQLRDQRRKTVELQARYGALAWRASQVLIELNTFRVSKVIGLYRKLRPAGGWETELADSFSRLKDDSHIFQDVSGYRLKPSILLNGSNYISHALRLARPGLSGIALAPSFDLPYVRGMIGIQLMQGPARMLVDQALPLEELVLWKPLECRFDPLAESDGELELRIFVRDADWPLRILEWQKPFPSVGKARRKPFAAYSFSN